VEDDYGLDGDIGGDLGDDIGNDIGSDIGSDFGSDDGVDFGGDLAGDDGFDLGESDISTDIGDDFTAVLDGDIGSDDGVDLNGSDFDIADEGTDLNGPDIDDIDDGIEIGADDGLDDDAGDDLNLDVDDGIVDEHPVDTDPEAVDENPADSEDDSSDVPNTPSPFRDNVLNNPEFFDENGDLLWPENAGFAEDAEYVTLEPGTLVDRYGGNEGSFTASAGTPYEQRSLPYEEGDMEFRTYEVLKPIDNVYQGATTPAFGESGGGTQQMFTYDMQYYIDNNYIREVE